MKRPAGVLLCLPGLVLAAVSFPEIKTVVEVSASGGAHMVQEWTCRFEGRSRQLRLTYPARFQGSRVTLNRLTERAGRHVWPVEDVETRDESGTLVVEWGPRARDETRRYVLDLTVYPAVRRYDDAAHVQIPVIGRASGPVGLATVELRLPSASIGQFHLTDATGTHGTISPDRAAGLLTRSGMEKGERMWVDAVTDPAVFTDVPRRAGRMTEVENRTLLRDQLPPPYGTKPAPRWHLALVPVLLPLVLLLVLYLLYGREPRVGYHARYEHEPPGRIPPLAVPSIMRQRPDVTETPMETLDATFATLVDAARVGVLDIVPGDGHTGHGCGFRLARPEKLGDMDEIGRKVVSYYFSSVSRGKESVTDRDIRRHAGEQPDSFWFWLSQMSQEGRDWWWKKLGVGFLEPGSSRAYRLLCVGAPVVTGLGWFLMPFGFSVLTFYLSLPLLLLLFVLSMVLSGAMYAYLGRVILRWSPPAYYEHLRWLSFRRFLVEFSAIKQAPIELSAIWQEYYVYAVALGIGDKFMHGLSRLAADLKETIDLRSPEGTEIGFEVSRPELHTREAFGQGISQMIEAFRSGSGLQGKRVGRLQSLLFWRIGKS